MPRHVRKSYTPRICVKCGIDARDLAYLVRAAINLCMTVEDVVYLSHHSTGSFVCTVCACGGNSDVVNCITTNWIRTYEWEVLQIRRQLREKRVLEARAELERERRVFEARFVLEQC
jgi:hypothetical protein